MKSMPRNVPASVRARLLNFSRSRQEDFNGTLIRYVSDDRESILTDIADICSVEAPSDGLAFDAPLATIDDIRENNRYHGVRIKVPVRLGNARVILQIDMGFGDAVHPAP